MATDSNSLQQRLRIAVSAVTGHQPEDLDADQFLESDLGIDSIKMVELTQSLLLIVAEPLRERFMAEVPTDRLMQVQTLRELETIFQGWDGVPRPPLRPQERVGEGVRQRRWPFRRVRSHPQPPLPASPCSRRGRSQELRISRRVCSR